MISRSKMAEVMDKVFEGCRAFRAAGQAEYAHAEENAMANFERVAERMGLTREQTLLVYLEKHMDGIHSYVQGHKSQREDVRGRIKDAIVYLTLLYGMVEDTETPSVPIFKYERTANATRVEVPITGAGGTFTAGMPGFDAYARTAHPEMTAKLRSAFPDGNWLCECGAVNGPSRMRCGFCAAVREGEHPNDH